MIEKQIKFIIGKLQLLNEYKEFIINRREEHYEELKNERLVNFCNGVEHSIKCELIEKLLQDNYMANIETTFDIFFDEKYLSLLKLLYLCDTGKSYN